MMSLGDWRLEHVPPWGTIKMVFTIVTRMCRKTQDKWGYHLSATFNYVLSIVQETISHILNYITGISTADELQTQEIE